MSWGWIAEAAKDIRTDIARGGARLSAAADNARQERQLVLALRDVWWPAVHRAPQFLRTNRGILAAVPVVNAGWTVYKRAAGKRKGDKQKALNKLRTQYLDGGRETWPKVAWLLLGEDGGMYGHVRGPMDPTDDHPLRGDPGWDHDRAQTTVRPYIGRYDHDRVLDPYQRRHVAAYTAG